MRRNERIIWLINRKHSMAHACGSAWKKYIAKCQKWQGRSNKIMWNNCQNPWGRQEVIRHPEEQRSSAALQGGLWQKYAYSPKFCQIRNKIWKNNLWPDFACAFTLVEQMWKFSGWLKFFLNVKDWTYATRTDVRMGWGGHSVSKYIQHAMQS